MNLSPGISVSDPATSSLPDLALRRWLQEPFFLFLVIAAGIFLLDQVVDRDADALGAVTVTAPEERPIVVSADVVNQLREEYSWLYGREPDAAETDLLVEGWIADEVVFREGLSRQMHLTDTRVRSLIIDKLRLLWTGAAESPDEATLLAYYVHNIRRYYSEPRISFAQVFFASLPEEPAALLTALRAGEVVQGEEFWLGNRLEHYSESILRNSFGGAFYRAIASLPPGRWQGPVQSARGFHFVQVLQTEASRPLDYADVRSRVASDWAQSQRAAGIAEQTRLARGRHRIVREAGP